MLHYPKETKLKVILIKGNQMFTKDESNTGETEGKEDASMDLVEEELEITDQYIESTEDEVKALQAKIVELQAKVDSNWDKALRATSELENIRRRAQIDVSNAHKFGIEKLLESLVPILDSIDQALKVESDDLSHLREGLVLTNQLFVDVLEKHNIVAIEPKEGDKFDPKVQEAMTTIPSDDIELGAVVTVIQNGYQLADRVVRPARVIVSAGPST